MAELQDTLEIRAVDYDHPDAVAMVAAVQQVYTERYGGGDSSPVAIADFTPPEGLFLIGYVDGVAAVCGGWRFRRAEQDPGVLRDGDVELKRMYVIDTMRGRGLARRILVELESRAAAAGSSRMVLETGIRQPEAIELYRSAGYGELPKFGYYRDFPTSRCFSKPLI